jgi:hypothetical protein
MAMSSLGRERDGREDDFTLAESVKIQVAFRIENKPKLIGEG